MSKKALIRQPSSGLSEGLVTHLERQRVDVEVARDEWVAYVEALGACGWETVEVEPIESCPDGVFVEDTMVVYANTAVLAHPGHPTRRPEVEAAEAAVAALGYSTNRIRPPGTLDGGDVLKVGRTIYVGRGGRTNAEGVRQLRAIVQPLGARVIAVPVTKVLHLKSAVTALPDGTVVGYTPLVDDPGFFPHYMAMPEESGAHVVDLGEGRVLMAADCPKSAGLVEDLGYRVVQVGISEFQKLEGCVTCLSVRLRCLSD
jgi:dimethylargininase